MPRSPRSAASSGRRAPRDPDVQSLLSGLPRCSAGGRSRARIPECDRRNRASAGPRRDRERRGAAVRARSPSISARPPILKVQWQARPTSGARSSLARAHDFMLFLDECYSELYSGTAPTGGLEVAAKTSRALPQPRRLQLALEALEPAGAALRLLGGRRLLFSIPCSRCATSWARRCRGRRSTRPRPSGPRSSTSPPTASAYGLEIRCGGRGPGQPFRLPAPGRRLLPLAQHEPNRETASHAAITLWKRFGVKVLPGAFLSQTGRDGTNPGADYVRVALVQDVPTIREALERDR